MQLWECQLQQLILHRQQYNQLKAYYNHLRNNRKQQDHSKIAIKFQKECKAIIQYALVT